MREPVEVLLSDVDLEHLDAVRENFARQVELQEAKGENPIFTSRAVRSLSAQLVIPMALALAVHYIRAGGQA